MSEGKDEDVFDDLFIKSPEEAERLKAEYESFLKKKRSLKDKKLELVFKGKKKPQFWIVKKQGIMIQYICPISKEVVQLQSKVWLIDLKKVIEEKINEPLKND